MNSVGNNSYQLPDASNSLTTKEVACQTSSDLHLALLMQEFPHLFQKSSLPSSVYDSPAQSDMKSSDRTLSVVRTPENSLRDCKFTTVSSITTSEKKSADAEFASRSILCDSLRTPINFPSKNSSPADISSISLLPSSEKKFSDFVTPDLDRRKLSIRLNFQKGTKLQSKNDIESPSTGPVVNDDEILFSKDIISCTEDSVIYSSNMKSPVAEKTLLSTCDTNETYEKQNSSSSVSEELKFRNMKEDDKGVENVEETICNNERDEQVIFTADPDFIPDTDAVQIQDDVEIFKDEEMYDHRTPKVKKIVLQNNIALL